MVVKDCSTNHGGGLALFWRRGVNLQVHGISRLYIDAEVTEEDGFVWRLTGFYGEPSAEKKHISWKALRTLNAAGRRPWVCLGDFNEILLTGEKEGGPPRHQACMDRFREALEDCELADLGFEGDPFTWRNNNHNSACYIRERLDRAVANKDWMSRFPLRHIINGEPRHSDHRPVIVDTDPPRNRGGRQSPAFRFEACWVEEEDCAAIVENAWRTVVAQWENVGAAIKNVAKELGDWGRNVLGTLEKSIKKTRKDLEAYRRRVVNADSVAREELLRFKLEKLEEKRNTYWRQRAKVHWLDKGDRNTRFFHQYASERKRRSRINRLVREDGMVEELLSQIPHKVSDDMNISLLRSFSAEEVKNGLDSIGDFKAPGSDGMTSLFYKKYWDLVGEDVTKEVLQFLNGGALPQAWNETVIVLIPKVPNPESLKDLRPISLCNVVYKIASKVLASRLKVILPEIISPNQSAFIPGWLITDNILVAYELTHFLQNKRSGAEGFAALKLDMSKAYDRVEWHFLRRMMEKMGFDSRWINLIMQCVSTVSYKIKVNGELTEEIVPTRGLRQGDPLSPYLFLICAEGFSSLLNEAERAGNLEGITICANAPCINHLLFADDSLLLLKVNEGNANYLRHVLQLYEECSGQMINKEKSSILFSKNCEQERKLEFMNALELTQEARSDKYLGLPVYMGRSRAKMFAYLKDRVWKRIQGWKEKLLSRAGKETLIKAVAQAIPSYAMSCFDLTKSLCDEISTMICRFWWAQQEKEKKLHWLSW